MTRSSTPRRSARRPLGGQRPRFRDASGVGDAPMHRGHDARANASACDDGPGRRRVLHRPAPAHRLHRVRPRDRRRLRRRDGRQRRPRAGRRGRAHRATRTLADGSRAATCEVGGETARRLGLGDGVQRGFRDVVEVWDGSAGARGLRGERDLARRAHQRRGRGGRAPARGSRASRPPREPCAGAVGEASSIPRSRPHSSSDPPRSSARSVRRDPRDVVLAIEPAPSPASSKPAISPTSPARSATSPTSSRRTRSAIPPASRPLPSAAGERLGLDTERLPLLEVAALLHDVGPGRHLECHLGAAGPLTRAEWEQVRLHPYHSERILAGSEALEPAATLAGMHHERLDGSGYHRGAGSREIPIEARDPRGRGRLRRADPRPASSTARSAEDAARGAAGDFDAGPAGRRRCRGRGGRRRTAQPHALRGAPRG